MENVILDMRGRIKRERITLKPSFKVHMPVSAGGVAPTHVPPSTLPAAYGGFVMS